MNTLVSGLLNKAAVMNNAELGVKTATKEEKQSTKGRQEKVNNTAKTPTGKADQTLKKYNKNFMI